MNGVALVTRGLKAPSGWGIYLVTHGLAGLTQGVIVAVSTAWHHYRREGRR